MLELVVPIEQFVFLNRHIANILDFVDATNALEPSHMHKSLPIGCSSVAVTGLMLEKHVVN